MTIKLNVPEHLTRLIDFLSNLRDMDESSALEELLQEGAEEYVVRLVSKGEISTSKSAELLGVTVYEIHQIAREKGIEISSTEEQFDQSRNTSKELLEG